MGSEVLGRFGIWKPSAHASTNVLFDGVFVDGIIHVGVGL